MGERSRRFALKFPTLSQEPERALGLHFLQSRIPLLLAGRTAPGYGVLSQFVSTTDPHGCNVENAGGG